jgi:hypothetical protein
MPSLYSTPLSLSGEFCLSQKKYIFVEDTTVVWCCLDRNPREFNNDRLTEESLTRSPSQKERKSLDRLEDDDAMGHMIRDQF